MEKTNNVGDITNKVSNAILESVINVLPDDNSNIIQVEADNIIHVISVRGLLLDLQTARQTIADKDKLIERLKADGERMHSYTKHFSDCAFHHGHECNCGLFDIDKQHFALKKEMEK